MTGGRILRSLQVAVLCGLAASVGAWAAAPVITGVSIPNVTMAIDDVVVATILVQSDSATTYMLSASHVGGYALGGLSRMDSTTYTATFTVVEGGSDYTAETDIPVSVTLTDGSTPDTWSTPIAQASDPLDANRPSVSNVAADTSPVYDGDLVQQITVTWSEAMATGAAPTIVFSSGTWTPGAAGAWSAGNTVWTRTYTLTDANVAVPNVTVDVTGAQDAAGNAQQDYAPQAEFSIDTENPTASVAANDVAIYDGDVGADRFVVTATFSEAMNPAIVPSLVYLPGMATTFTSPSGAWGSGNTVYTWTYDVADDGATVLDVDLMVSGGADVSGNTQIAAVRTDYIDVDLQNPTVVILANDVAIYDGDVGTDRFTVTATFSETMNEAVAPTLTLTPNPSTTLTNPGGGWSVGNTVYTWTYDVADAGVTVADVDVTVSAGRDVAGNTQVSNTNTDYVDIDTQNPTVASVVASDLLLSDADAGGSLVVTVDFSEPMTPTAVPTFTFSPSVATTLSFSSGSWVDADTYQGTYGVSDANVDVNSVTIDVINAKDAAGNDQQNYVAAHEFEIDTLNPTVAGVAASDVLIADSDAGLTRYITADFSEPMDAAAVPVFSFSSDITSTLTLTSGTWQTTTRYRASYVAADAGVDVDSVTVDATATTDVAGNAQQDYVPQGEFAIDTLNPTVAGILLSDSLITDADVGGTFIVTVSYSEPMLSGTAPAIVFVPGLGTTLSILGSSGWSDADTYAARYAIVDGGVTVNDDDVQTSLARDLAGNVQIALGFDDDLDVDTENPIISGFSVTGGQVGTKGANGCVREVPFSATVTDPNGCMDPSDIVITSATVPGGNADITAPYGVARTAVSPTISTISGVVDVYDLTGCPAVSRIVLDATDCVGNSAVQAQEEDNVYDAIVPTINAFTFNADATYATPADEYVVNGCCVTTVYFSADVTDNCCIGAGSITVVVTLPTGNALLENVSVQRAQNGQKRVDITGHADVRCLTSCPARVQVHIEAADCCGNAAMPITSLPSTGLIYDETPPTAFDDPNGYEAARCDELEVRRDDFGQFRLMIRESTPSYIDVVCNDTDNCSACTCCAMLWIYDIVDQPEFGTATIVDNIGDCHGGTSIRYAPNRGYLGPDRFTYRIIDACGNVSETATVRLQTIREVDLADVFAVACSGETTGIVVTATDLWIAPDDPSRVPFRFDLASGPEHGILAFDPSVVRYEPPSTVVSGGALVPTLTFMESASLTLFYTAARDYVGRDAVRVGFEDPFGGRVVGNVDIEVQDCARNGVGAALGVQQGQSLILVPPSSFADLVGNLPGAISLMSLDDGLLRPDAVALTWNEDMLRYFLVVNTGVLPLGRYRLQLSLGNGETVGLLVEVGESE